MTTAVDYESKRWQALALLCIAQFMVVLDASIVNIALPTIGDALDFSQDDLSWVVNAYVLTFGGFLLLGGRLADLLGRRRVFMAGLILFALASAIAIDAFVIRSVLVPAIMALLGRRAWWLPDWLDRVMPNISLDESRELEGVATEPERDRVSV